MVCAVVGVFSALADEGAVAVPPKRDAFYDEVSFIGVYKTTEKRECVIAVGDEAEINRQRKFVSTTSGKPFQVTIICKGATSMTTVDSLDHVFKGSMEYFSPITGMSVLEILSEFAVKYSERVNPRVSQ